MYICISLVWWHITNEQSIWSNIRCCKMLWTDNQILQYLFVDKDEKHTTTNILKLNTDRKRHCPPCYLLLSLQHLYKRLIGLFFFLSLKYLAIQASPVWMYILYHHCYSSSGELNIFNALIQRPQKINTK